jgi:hypothetical protein
MAVTAAGSPYIESSDLVANYPGASLALAERVDQVVQAPTQNPQTGTTYQPIALDAGKTVTLSNASAVTLTIPTQASASWADNTQLNFLNIGAGTVTITPAAGVTINGTPLTLATSKGGSLVRTASNTWTFIPFSGGEGPATYSATTGSPTVTTVGAKTCLEFTASGTITLTRGTIEYLIVSGGSPGVPGNHFGLGGPWMYGKVGVEAGTFTVTVGAQSNGSGGGRSSFDTIVAASAGFTNAASLTGLTSSITGTALEYSRTNQASARVNKGDCGGLTTPGSSGVVILLIG